MLAAQQGTSLLMNLLAPALDLKALRMSCCGSLLPEQALLIPGVFMALLPMLSYSTAL